MNTNITASLASIDNFYNKVEAGYEVIDKSLEHIVNMTNEMEMFFDTPTGKKVKEEMLELLYIIKNENEKLVLFDKNIKYTYEIYQEQVEYTKRMLGGDI